MCCRLLSSVAIGIVLVASVASGQWSEPAVLYQDTAVYIRGPFLICPQDDTVLACYILPGGGMPTWYQVRVQWTVGDSWSEPYGVTPPDTPPGWCSGLGAGRDPEGHLWLAWYRGNGYTFVEDSWAIWTAMRDSSGWHPAQWTIGPYSAPGLHTFASDRQGNWYMGIEEFNAPLPSLYSSAMFSRLDGDTWLWPKVIAEGYGSPVYLDYLAPTLVPRPDTGVWSVCDLHRMGAQEIHVHHVVPDTALRITSFDGTEHAATADSVGRLWIVYLNDSILWSTVLGGDEGYRPREIVSTDVHPVYWNMPKVCTDHQGWVWVTWTRTDTTPVVSYNRGNGWTEPEPVIDSVGWTKGITSDSWGRIYVLFRTDWRSLYTVYREYRPGVTGQKPPLTFCESRTASVVQGMLSLAGGKPAILLDISGRKVAVLQPGENDIRYLAPGVYFLRQDKDRMTCRVVVQR